MIRVVWIACLVVLASVQTADRPVHAQEWTGGPKAKSSFVAKLDCNSTNCHGSVVANDRIGKRSGDIWQQYDPHSFAYLNLRTEESLEIVRRLWVGPEALPSGVDEAGYHRFLEDNCVACHASEWAPVGQRSVGIDCQACHGSASVWGDSHLLQAWKDLKEERFADESAKGRINTGSPWQLASTCGSCHVGELNRTGRIEFDDGTYVPIKQREVTHQLMAAGHPPTYFDLGHYLRRYPKHWPDGDDAQAPISSRSLDVWRIGKIVNANQRLELLINRLGRPEWPEFTEHRCTSCHHPIGHLADARIGGEDKLVQSQAFARWDGWYLEQVDLALAITQFPRTQEGSKEFAREPVVRWTEHYNRLHQLLLNPLSVHSEDLERLARKEAAALQEILEGVITQKLPLFDTKGLELVRKEWVERNIAASERFSWESAVQIRLAAIAIDHTIDPQGNYPPIAQEAWDLPIEMWKRPDRMPYKASWDFDAKRFYEQLHELSKSHD